MNCHELVRAHRSPRFDTLLGSDGKTNLLGPTAALGEGVISEAIENCNFVALTARDTIARAVGHDGVFELECRLGSAVLTRDIATPDAEGLVQRMSVLGLAAMLPQSASCDSTTVKSIIRPKPSTVITVADTDGGYLLRCYAKTPELLRVEVAAPNRKSLRRLVPSACWAFLDGQDEVERLLWPFVARAAGPLEEGCALVRQFAGAPVTVGA
jgi:hypothetical protein